MKKVSAQLIIDCLEKLINVHHNFLQFADEKTEYVKKGDISHLRALMQKEAVLLKQLQRLEEERTRLVHYYMGKKGLVTEGGTISEMLPHVSKEEGEELLTLQKQLLTIIKQLKEKNELNQQLLQDSLRFVNLSLDVIQPEFETGNYGRKNNDDEPMGRSLFDSKA